MELQGGSVYRWLGLATLYVYTIKRNQLTAAGIVNALRSSCGDRLELHQATCSWCCCAQRRWIVVVGVAFPGVYCVYHGRWRREIGTRLMLSYGNQSRHEMNRRTYARAESIRCISKAHTIEQWRCVEMKRHVTSDLGLFSA